MTTSELAALKSFLIPRLQAIEWDDPDDPLAAAEGKAFNAGVKFVVEKCISAFEDFEQFTSL